MESNSPIRKKVNIRSRSRSRSHSKDKHRSHHKKKKTPKVLIEENSKLEEGTKIEESSHDDKELERKFKDFEAEIHAIDPSNKSEKNETKQKKTFETTENLLLLYNKRIYVEGFPLEEFEKNEPSPKIREDFKQFFQEFKTLSILTSSQEGKQLLLIEFESRESMDSAIKLLENYEYQDSKLEIHKYLNNEDTYERKDLILPKHFKNDTELSDNQEIIPKILEPEPKHEEIAAEVYPQNFQKESQHANEYNQNDPYSPSNNSQNQQAFYPPQQLTENESYLSLQQNGYPYLNYDQMNLAQTQAQYLYSLNSLKQQPFISPQDYSQYQYQSNYYQQPQALPDLTSVQSLNTNQIGYKNPEYNSPQDYGSGFNLNSLNLQMNENPNALQLMPKILPEANVFIKNLNPITTTKDLENAFRVYGNIVSSKIATDYYNQSLSYGYIQFELKESADTCIQQANNAVFQDMIISVQPFNSKLNKIDGRNNLYIKNLPTYLNDEQLNQKIMEIFSKFGPITSSVVKLDRSLNRPFAFVCFENHIYADMAFKALHDTDPFRSGNRLYISWAEKKIDRVKRLTELHSSQQNLQQGSFGMMGINGGGGGYYQSSNSGINYKGYEE